MNTRLCSAIAGALILTIAVTSGSAQNTGTASIADVTGPGQVVAQPAAECPRTVGCQYSEQNLLPNGYRFRSVQVCGANCTTQYWVSSMATGDPYLENDPLRRGAILAVAPGAASGGHPSMRVVKPQYGPTDPACCPSSYTDATCTWDVASNSLAVGASSSTPADQFPGFEAARQELNHEGWLVANV